MGTPPSAAGSYVQTIRAWWKHTAFRLGLSLLVSVIVIVSVLTLFSYRQARSILDAESAKASLQTIIQTGRGLDNLMQRYKDIVDSLVHDQDLVNKLTVFSEQHNSSEYEMASAQLGNLLSAYIRSNRTVESITLFAADGSHTVTTLARELSTPSLRVSAALQETAWYRAIQSAQTGTVFLDARKSGFVSGNPADALFGVASLIRNPFNQNVLGTILIEVSTEQIKNELSGFQLGKGGGYAIVGSGGRVVFSQEERLIEGTFSGALPPESGPSAAVKAGNYTAKDGHGSWQNYSYQQSPLTGWYLIGYYPKEEMLAPMRGILWNSLWISLLCSAAAALCVGFLVHRGVGRPLRKLRLLMLEGEMGNMAVRTEYDSDTEIGDLGRAFNRMMARISLAYYDTLTNLPNRRLLIDRLEEELTDRDARLAVLFVDLDRFKMVNDSFGHQAGDELIRLVGQRLQSCVRENDTVARIAGDEFVILLPYLADREVPVGVAERVLGELRAPFSIAEHEVRISGSVGIAYYPEDGADAEELLRSADMSMYEAKSSGKNNFKTYEPGMSARMCERTAIEFDLVKALEQEQFELYYQPLVDVATRSIVGAEALLRWNHEQMGMIPPDKFIPIAEDTGIIVPLGQWVLRQACRQNKAWQEVGLPPMRIAVNVSGRQIGAGFVDGVARILEETGLDGRWLQIEITESVLIENEASINDTLSRLKAMNITISIDDFGTGYSNLAYLMKFEVDTLKVDKSFIRGIHRSSDNQTVVPVVIGLAHNLGMRVILEGVETAEEYAYLAGLGAEEMQGYYFSKPVPAGEYRQLLAHAQEAAAAGEAD